jgi:hypothetical protein
MPQVFPLGNIDRPIIVADTWKEETIIRERPGFWLGEVQCLNAECDVVCVFVWTKKISHWKRRGLRFGLKRAHARQSEKWMHTIAGTGKGVAFIDLRDTIPRGPSGGTSTICGTAWTPNKLVTVIVARKKTGLWCLSRATLPEYCLSTSQHVVCLLSSEIVNTDYLQLCYLYRECQPRSKPLKVSWLADRNPNPNPKLCASDHVFALDYYKSSKVKAIKLLLYN